MPELADEHKLPDSFKPADSPYGQYKVTEAIRHLWLWLIGAGGVALVGLAVCLNLIWGVENILPSAALNIGAGMMLFSAFFLVERRIVRSTGLVPLEPLAVIADQTGQDLDALREDHDGPMETVGQLVQAVMYAGDLRSAWPLLAPNLRLCRAQQWLWVNRAHPSIERLDLEKEAVSLARLDSESVLWSEFAECELSDFSSAWSDPDIRTCGIASRRREVEAGRIIQLVDVNGTDTAYIVNRATAVRGHVFLVSQVEGDWLVSSLSGDTLPEPGFPPEWHPGWKYFEPFLDK